MGAWGVGMRANDTALDAILHFRKYDGGGCPVLTRRGKLVKDGDVLLKALKWVYNRATKGRIAWKGAADEQVLGVAELFMERGINPGKAREFILASIERELSKERLDQWCDPEERKGALLRFKDDVCGKPTEKKDDHKDEQAVVLVGNPSDGWEVFGPFKDFDTASTWANFPNTWVTSLRRPESRGV